MSFAGQAAITGISCYGSAPNVSCAASALSYLGLDYPFVLTSNDGLANSWSVALGVPQTQCELFLGIACAPVGTSATCVAHRRRQDLALIRAGARRG